MSWVIAKWIVKNAGIGKVQRGVTTAAGIVTIAPVDMDKAFVISVSKGSAGTVAATGTVGAAAISSGSISGNITGTLSGSISNSLAKTGSLTDPRISDPTISISGTRSLAGSMSGTVNAASISGGITNLIVKEYSARLISPTELQCDGPVEWQVVG